MRERSMLLMAKKNAPEMRRSIDLRTKKSRKKRWISVRPAVVIERSLMIVEQRVDVGRESPTVEFEDAFRVGTSSPPLDVAGDQDALVRYDRHTMCTHQRQVLSEKRKRQQLWPVSVCFRLP